MELNLQVASASMTLFHLIDMNTVLLDTAGSVMLLHERDSLPDFARELQRESYARFAQETLRHPHCCCMFTDAWGFSYISSAFAVEKEAEAVIVLGPFLKQVPDMNGLERIFPGPPSQFALLQEFYRGLKLVSTSKLQSIANLLKQAAFLQQAPMLSIDTKPRESDKLPHEQSALHPQQADENEGDLIALRYKLETELMHAIEKGNKPALHEMKKYAKNMYDFSERFPNQPIRALRNMLIVLNTLLRIAARNGKVHPVYLHRLSEKFSKQIERSDSIDSLNALADSMYDEYCAMVQRRSVTGYSPLVQQAIQYLMVHMSSPLDLRVLAEHCHAHPSHLSRQFKKETGFTLTDYLNRLRVEEAKLLLLKERVSVDWIAGFVGFEDAGYFARVFKKLAGVTPTQYRSEKG